MLKKRFGDTTLQVCEVMLKDMTDSKRINGQVQRVKEVWLWRRYWIRYSPLIYTVLSEPPETYHFVSSLLAKRSEQESKAAKGAAQVRVKLPQSIAPPQSLTMLIRLQEDYICSFGKVKQDKHLKFFNMLGTIQLTVDLQDRTIDVEVTPLQATVLDAFSKRGMWAVQMRFWLGEA
jgi:anaphase-promoting complex subunit 2